MTLFLTLLAGHYLADFPLQPPFVAEKKGLVFIESIGFHALTSHAAIHGLVAGYIAGSEAGLIVAVSHWLIDFGKAWQGWPENWRITNGAKWAGNPGARGLYGINVDQSLHVLVLIAVVLWV
jgi:hypothetical protein